MSDMTIELNSIRRDSDYGNGRVTKESPVVEIFGAMARGENLSRFGAKADKAVNYIKELGEKANNGDGSAMSELNAIRRFNIEPLLLEEIKLLNIFGAYTPVAIGESIEREVYNHTGDMSRMQAPNGDVTFPAIKKEVYPVAPVTISGGYVVDYRALAAGNAQRENEGMEQVRRDIRNKAALYIVKTVYNAVKNATGVKYWGEAAGITQTALDNIVKNVRRFGKTTIVGDYATVSQINNFAGWTDGTHFGISDAAIEEIRKTGLLGMYKGSVVRELENPFNLTEVKDGNFVPYLPEGLLFVLPTGADSPIMTWNRGGLTSMTGNDVATGHVMTRFDMEIAADVAKGREFQIGLLNDTNLTPVSEYAI